MICMKDQTQGMDWKKPATVSIRSVGRNEKGRPQAPLQTVARLT